MDDPECIKPSARREIANPRDGSPAILAIRKFCFIEKIL